MAPRPTVSSRKPSAALEPEERPKKVLDDLAMRTITSAVRRDLWRELNRYALDEECTIQSALNRAIHAFLLAQHRPVTAPLEDA